MLVKMKTYVISIWIFLDPIYYFFTRLTYVKDIENKNILRVRLTRYKGRPCVLEDGTSINKNDLLVKIHLHNVLLLKEIIGLQGETAKARLIFKHVKNSMPNLAQYLYNHPKGENIKGVIGITALNKGCNKLGFETVPISNIIYRLFKQIVFLPMYCMSVSTLSLKNLQRPPKYLFMSKEKLLRLYYQDK